MRTVLIKCVKTSVWPMINDIGGECNVTELRMNIRCIAWLLQRIFYFRNRIVVTRCVRLEAKKNYFLAKKEEKIAAGDIVDPSRMAKKVE